MAEWFKAAVLKTVDPKGSGSSNLSPSAICMSKAPNLDSKIYHLQRLICFYQSLGILCCPLRPIFVLLHF